MDLQLENPKYPSRFVYVADQQEKVAGRNRLLFLVAYSIWDGCQNHVYRETKLLPQHFSRWWKARARAGWRLTTP